jgi:pimeloyl-ACP methyl ester carboxylesterase
MTIAINDEQLAFRMTGSGQPLVLVHANISDLRSWEPIESLLAERFQVINYSRRFAHPNRPIDPGVDDQLEVHAQDLIALIEAQDLGPVHLLGNSSGAIVSLLVAHQRPDLVRSLSLEEPPVVSMFVKALPPKPAEMFKLLVTAPGALVAFVKFGAGSMGPSIKAFQRGDDDAALDAFGKGVLGVKAYANVSAARRRQMRDNLAVHRAALLGAGLPVFTPEQAKALTVPTQLIRGSETSHFQRRINQRLAALIPGARDVVVSSASHLVHEDDPAAVAGAVREFVHDLGNV